MERSPYHVLEYAEEGSLERQACGHLKAFKVSIQEECEPLCN